MSSSRKTPLDDTLKHRWLVQHSDRFLAYEYEMARRESSGKEMFPEEIADRIGRSTRYVQGLIKDAYLHAREALSDRG